MKKTYITPAVKATALETFSLIANSITGVGTGNNAADITIGDGETPEVADVKSSYNVWDDDWSE